MNLLSPACYADADALGGGGGGSGPSATSDPCACVGDSTVTAELRGDGGGGSGPSGKARTTSCVLSAAVVCGPGTIPNNNRLANKVKQLAFVENMDPPFWVPCSESARWV